MARVATIQRALPREHGVPGTEDVMQRPFFTAFHKEPVDGPVWVSKTGLEGDGVGDPVHHGGPEKAVLAYSADHYPGWRAETYVQLPHGAFGENFTVAGADEETVCIGDVYDVGEARVQVSQPRQPCWKIARRWGIRDLSLRVHRSGRTGWYLRVLREGTVAPGDVLRMVDCPHPQWTIARINRALAARPRDFDTLAKLAQVPVLPPKLARDLARFAAARPAEDDPDAGLVVTHEAE
jgi:MOSC domain-containing protein YiiM